MKKLNMFAASMVLVGMSVTAQAGHYNASEFVNELLQGADRSQLLQPTYRNIESSSVSYYIRNNDYTRNRLSSHRFLKKESGDGKLSMQNVSENALSYKWQCAGLIQEVVPSIGFTKYWSPMKRNTPTAQQDDWRDFKRGDVIATFDNNGNYGQNFDSHVAIVLGKTSSEVVVLDQNWEQYGGNIRNGGPMMIHHIDTFGSGVTNIHNYSRIQS